MELKDNIPPLSGPPKSDAAPKKPAVKKAKAAKKAKPAPKPKKAVKKKPKAAKAKKPAKPAKKAKGKTVKAPPRKLVRTARLDLRCTPAERAKAIALAKKRGKTVTEIVMEVLAKLK